MPHQLEFADAGDDRKPLADLLDTSKSDDFVSKIEASDIPHDIKMFLKKAASRHIVFRYDNDE